VTNSYNRPRHVIAAIWIFAIFLGIGMALAQRYDDRVQQARLAEFRAAQQKLRDEDEQLLGRILRFYHERRNIDGMMPRRADAMELLAQSASPEISTNPVDEAIFTDPKSGARVRLNLIGDRWQAYRLLRRTALPPRMPIAVTLLRRAMLAGATLAWLLIVFLRPVHRAQRQAWAHLLTAVAGIVTLTMALEPPHAALGWGDRIVGAGTIFWVAALTISIVSLILAYRKPIADHPICRNCGYNLTGNTSGICPECGAPASPASAPPHRA